MRVLVQSPTDEAFVQNPYPFYDRARAGGDFVVWKDYDRVCATTFRAVSAVLRDRRMGRTPPPDRQPKVAPHTAAFYAVEANSMLELEPPRHTRLRNLVVRAFTSRRIARMGPEIERLSRDLAGAFPSGPFDLIPAFCEKVPVIVIARLLGVPESMADQLLAWSHRMVAMYQARRTHAVEVAAGLAAAEFADFMRGYIQERRSRPADDLLTHLIAAEEDGERLSTDEMIATTILLLNAGHEATVHTLGNGVKAALEYGIDPVAITPDSAPAMVEEVLRWDPPLHMFTRWVYEPVDLFGQHFEPGTQIAALLASAGRDPASCEDADRFVPFRDEAPHMAFGLGLHFCVGAPLARLEMQVSLRVLFHSCPRLRLAEPPRYGDVYHFHGLERLKVQQ